MDERKEKGWQAEDTPEGFRETRGSGVGAVAGRGMPVVEDVAHETKARTGAIPDEHMREGWGGEGEVYAPTQGPNHRQEGDQPQEKRFWQGKPPAGID